MKDKSAKSKDNLTVSVKDVRLDPAAPDFVLSELDSETFTKKKIIEYQNKGRDDAFYVTDLNVVEQQYDEWASQLPRVKPFYDMKCNHDPVVLYMLAKLGCNFACSSQGEISRLLEMDVDPGRMIFSSPCKQVSHICHAARTGVDRMVFDNELELDKFKEHFPKARLILLIKLLDTNKDDDSSLIEHHYGCKMESVQELLQKAKDLELDVIGVSFQINDVHGDMKQFGEGLNCAEEVVEMAQKIGYNINLLDIGGGFPGGFESKHHLREICSELRDALKNRFPESSGVTVIAEPGPYFVQSAFNLVANITSKRIVQNSKSENDAVTGENTEPKAFIYYVNDGLFGLTPRYIPECELIPECKLLKPDPDADEPRFPSSIWDQTSTSGQRASLDDVTLPELHVGDFLVIKNIGAYSFVLSAEFTSPEKPTMYYTVGGEKLTEKKAKKLSTSSECSII